jgi:hypothetical protein
VPGVFTHDDWFTWLSEPVRVRPRYHALDHLSRNAAWFGIATSPFLRDWYRPFSEPVRSKPPLPRGASPYFFIGINYVQYRFAMTEAGDTLAMGFAEYPRKNRARVSITEINMVNKANVTITEIEPGF